MSETEVRLPSRRGLLLTAGAAIAVGAAIVVLFVLPAETGIDPTGMGEATGLSDMANPDAARFLERGVQRKGVFTPGEKMPSEAGASDYWTYDLQPYESIELKYVIDKDQPVSFEWTASTPVNYDMHAHPFDGGEELTESYSIAKADHLAGSYVAAFSGIHGWHWQNRGFETVHLKLKASGAIKGSKLIDRGGEHDRALTPETP
ncbi:hypothetical protein [Sphingobium cloacae]|uniref:Uncharacterized protein n=1 Tax=Sphingobium cloacae TaxID=120107 RepID=A0A1E1EYJ2_9SPHN|nr:hypothetical protein [Sphingobium cloacae]BAV63336.1 hypothetical protein SCLO_1002960 [Sphingobium cloacae]